MVDSVTAAQQAGGSLSGVLNIAQLLNQIAPIFLGSGTTTDKTTGTTGTTGSTTGTTTASTVSGANPNILQSMIDQMNQALRNATDPSAVKPIVDNIIQQAKIAFGPTLAGLPTSGIYNSTSLGLLAGNAAAKAASDAAAVVLNFETDQQRTAAGIGANLLTATKTTDSTQQQAQQSAQTQQQQQVGTKSTSPVIPGTLSALLGAAGIPLITDQLGLTNIFGTKTPGGLIKRLTDSLGLTTPTAQSGGAEAFGINPEDIISNTLGSGGGGGVAPSVANFTSGGNFAGLTTDPSIEALAALAIPGTQAQAISLGNLGAQAINPQIGSLPDPFVSIAAPSTAAAATTPAVGSAVTEFSGGAATGIGGAENVLPNEADGTIGAFGTTSELVTPNSPTLADSLPGSLGAESQAPGVTGGFFDEAGKFISSSLVKPVQNAFTDIFGQDVGGFLTTPAPGIGTQLSDIGNVFDTGFGSEAVGTAAADIGAGLASAGAGVAGGLLGGLVHKGNAIGSGVGSTIGGIAGGAILGPVGAFAGSFLGDIVGSLFGQQHPENRYFYMPTTISNGRLSYGQPIAQNFGGEEYNTTLGLQQQLNSFNSLLDKTGLKVESSAKPFFLGTANPHGNDPVNTFGSIGDAFSNLRFSSDNPDVNKIVTGQTFAHPADLIAALQSGSAPAGSSAQPSQTTAPQPQVTAAAPQAAAPPAIPANAAIVDPFQIMAALGINAQPFTSGGAEHEGGGTG